MLAIIPARAGSKGIQNKNKKLFCGRPLIEWTVEIALKAKSVKRILVTSDDPDILNNAFLKKNVDYIVRRPIGLSKDSSPATTYISHAFNVLGGHYDFEYFCVLQPTSPLRISSDIDNLYEKVRLHNAATGVTVVKLPHNYTPEKIMYQRGDLLVPTDDSKYGRNLRQLSQQYFARNGAAVYIATKTHFDIEKSLFSSLMAFYEMPMKRSIDIDTQEDFELAELIMKAREK